MNFVSDWREAWKWFSVQFLAVLAIIPLVWEALPPELREWVPVEWRPWLLFGIAVVGIFGRLVDQNKPADPPVV
jgi:hypothetical protein